MKVLFCKNMDIRFYLGNVLRCLLHYNILTHLHVLQSGIEKNLFGNHQIPLPVPDSRAPPPAFASDPLVHVSSSGSMSTSVVNDAGSYLGTTGTGSTKPSTIDIEEIDDPSAANQANFIRSVSPKSTFVLICS